MLLLLSGAAAFTPGQTTFGTFGNAEAKALIQAWQPRPLNVPNGEVMLPSSTENMKRFVRARILLEDANTGCVTAHHDSSDGTSLCVILTKFNKAEHQLLMPLWQPGCEATSTFERLVEWHGERFQEGARLSGKSLEWPDDRAAWAKVCRGEPGI